MYLSNNKSPQKISKLLNYPASIYMLFGSASTQEEALKSMYEAFGENGRKIPAENDMILIASSWLLFF